MTHSLNAGGNAIEVTSSTPPVQTDGGWIVTGSSVTVATPIVVDRFYRQGWHSWALTRWEDLDEPPVRLAEGWGGFGADNVAILGPEHRSSWVGAVESADGSVALVLGALGLDAHVTGSHDGLVGEARDDIEWFVGLGQAEALLERYAELIGERCGNVRQDPGRVWCSWYSYYEDITEAEMVEVLDGLAGMGFGVVQIDDGWQAAVGDWAVNEDFPEGMAAMAERISTAGYRPGLWLAPFIALESSHTFREHPDWFVSVDGAPTAAGSNWGETYYGLDTTHPDVRHHIHQFIAQAVDWGYTYLKLDFLFAAGIPGERYDPDISDEEAYRSGVELIRRAAGDDTYLLACGSLIIPSIGVFNGMRVGQDVAPHWENRAGGIEFYSEVSTQFAISNSLARLWLDPVVAVDPDVVYFRSEANEMTEAQMRSLQDIASVCGFVATSDPPHWMTDQERSDMRDYMTRDPEVERINRYEFRIDDRPVSFRDASLDA